MPRLRDSCLALALALDGIPKEPSHMKEEGQLDKVQVVGWRLNNAMLSTGSCYVYLPMSRARFPRVLLLRRAVFGDAAHPSTLFTASLTKLLD